MSQNNPTLNNNNSIPNIQSNSTIKNPVQNVSNNNNNNNQNIKSNNSNNSPPSLNQLNSQYKYSLIWEKSEGEGSMERPAGREGSILINIPEKNQFLLFSGISHLRYADVFIYDLNTKKWSLKTCIGVQPKDLCYAVGWYDSPYFFFYGGRNKELSLNDTYFLDTNKFLWRKVYTMEQPMSRFYHSGVKIPNEKSFYIYGGVNIDRENKLLSDMYKYDYSKLNYNELDNDKVGGSVWKEVNYSGINTPGPRKGHTMIYYKDFAILYGGETEKGLNDENFYKFTFDNKQWNILKISGVKPGCRAYHTMNFFKPDSLIIFGGKKKVRNKIETTNSLVYIDLKMMDSSNPFVADIGPSPRFGHCSSYNAYFNKDGKEYLHVICGGLEKAYPNMDIFYIKEIEINENRKWIYTHKNEHSANKIDGSDEVYETAKKTIIMFKKKLEEATRENIAINKVYSEYFQTLNKYVKRDQDENYSSNEKKSKMEIKKNEIEKEKREIQSKNREIKEYNNLLNNFIYIQREKSLLLNQILTDYLRDVSKIDKMFEIINNKENKLLLFSDVNLDNLTVKRRNYKNVMEEYIKKNKEYSLFEKSIYESVINKQNEQKEKFKSMYFIIDDKQALTFKEEKKKVDLDKNIIK